MRTNCLKCKTCGAEVRWDKYDQHCMKVHGRRPAGSKMMLLKTARRVAPGMLECPKCKFRVRDRDLKAHFESMHLKKHGSPAPIQGGLVSPR